MTVQANNVRSDYMISDAALPKVSAESAEKFRGMLVEYKNKMEKYSELKKAYDSGKYDVPDAEELTGSVKTGADLLSGGNQKPVKLAKLLASGKISVKDIPAEYLTPELMEQVIMLKQMGFSQETVETADDVIEGISDIIGAAKIPTVQQLNTENSGDIAGELAKILESFRGEEQTTDVKDAGLLSEEADIVNAVDAALSEQEVIPVGDFAADTEPKQYAEQSAGDNSTADQAGAGSYVQQIKAAEHSLSEEGTVELTAGQAQILNRAAESGELSEPVVKQAQQRFTAEETTGESEVVSEEKADIPQVKTTGSFGAAKSDERTKSVNEELEMLRSAKPAKAAEKQDSIPEAAAPHGAAQSVLLMRRDGSTVEVKAADIAQQVLKILQEAVRENKDSTEYSMVLNPEELGKITVKLTKAADGAVSVTIAAENARTQRILEQHSELMQSNLKDSGVKLESWQTVSDAPQDTRADDYRGSAKNPYREQQTHKNDSDSDGESFADIIASM